MFDFLYIKIGFGLSFLELCGIIPAVSLASQAFDGYAVQRSALTAGIDCFAKMPLQAIFAHCIIIVTLIS